MSNGKEVKKEMSEELIVIDLKRSSVIAPDHKPLKYYTDKARREEQVRLIKELSEFSKFNDTCIDNPKDNDEWFILIGEQDFKKLFSKEALDEDLKITMEMFKKIKGRTLKELKPLK